MRRWATLGTLRCAAPAGKFDLLNQPSATVGLPIIAPTCCGLLKLVRGPLHAPLFLNTCHS